MADLNKVFLMGRLTFDPELRRTPMGTAVAELRLATSRTWTNRDGEPQKETLYIDVTVWDRLAENCCQYLKKGSADPRRWLPQDGRVDRQDDRRQADKDQGPRRPRPVPRPPRRLVGRRDGDGGGRVLGPVGRLVPPTRPGPTPTTPRRPRRGGRRYPVLTDIRNVAPVVDLVDKFASQARRHRLQPARWTSTR